MLKLNTSSSTYEKTLPVNKNWKSFFAFIRLVTRHLLSLTFTQICDEIMVKVFKIDKNRFKCDKYHTF